MQRKRLSDILPGAGGLADTWAKTEAAAEFAPLPKGEYDAVIVQGELFTARTGTPGYKLTFEVPEGEYAGRRFWHEVWLTQAALPLAKRDLGKLGITRLEQLEQPLPARFRCRAKLALRKEDDGTERNRVVRFEVVGVEKPDPFAPPAAEPPPAEGGAP
jgi:hypothetical protein